MNGPKVGVPNVELKVRPEDVERARQAIADSEKGKEILESEDFDPGEPVE